MSKEYFPLGSHMHNFLPWNMDELENWKDTDALLEIWWKMKIQDQGASAVFIKGTSCSAYHRDADLLHRLCDVDYTGGFVAHCEFPIDRLEEFSGQIKAAGYSVRTL